MRLFELEAICENYLARCRRSALKKQQRESEGEDAERRLLRHEEDRSGLEGARRRRRKFEGGSAVVDHGARWSPGRATAMVG